MKRILPFLFIAFGCSQLYGQYTTPASVLETNPASIKWRQVNTAHFRVLYPVGFDEQAQRVANTLERIHDPESKTMGSSPRKISIVLQNQSAISNGFVTILPRHSEFYTMPPQDYNFLGTNDWLNMLMSHEYRHVVQYQHATRGFNRAMYYLFGNTTLAAWAQVAAPQWFWEGDAVATETAFTHSGRGRIPNFGLVFKTNLMEGRTFNYHKQYLRSYKNNIPNHYVLGYHMISYLRRRTGDPNIWGKITARSWNVPFIPFAFSNAIHNKTGMYVTELYRDMAADLKKEWQQQLDQLQLTPFEKINPRSTKAYTDYLYPQAAGDAGVVAMKRGIGNIEEFVLLKDGHEQRIFVPGFINDAGMLSVADRKIVWSEYGYDPRWGVRNYSLIKLYDGAIGERRILAGRHERLSGAAISPDGKTVVAIRSDNDYKNSIVLLDVASGRVMKTLDNPENYFFAMPRWSADGKSIVVLKNSPAGKTISLIDPASGMGTDLLPVSRENVGSPIMQGKYVLFNSPVSGIDNIYAIDIETKTRYQVTSSKYAAYNPSVSTDGRTLYYSDQNRDGLDVVKTPFDPASWKAYSMQAPPSVKPLYQALADQEHHGGLLDTVSQTPLPVKKYSKLKGVFNPYSWGLFVTNNLAQINAGITSQDILSTTSISAGYLYDINEKTSYWNAGVSYQGLYPIIDVNATTGNRKEEKTDFNDKQKFTWNETGAEVGLRLPFLLTRSKYSRTLTLGDAAGFTKTTDFVNTVSRDNTIIYQGPNRITPVSDSLVFLYKDQLNNGTMYYNRLNLSFTNVLKRSQRDFLYRWGQTVDVDLYSTPFGGDFYGSLFAVRSTLYFPGLAKHHFLYGRLGYQKSYQSIETDVYSFRNRIPRPRGYSYPNDETFGAASVNYALPLWYPDIAFGPLLNIQRIKANFFCDFGQGQGRQYYYKPNSNIVYYSETDATYQSVGVETTFDFNILRFLPKFEAGFRTTYRSANKFQNSGVLVEFLIGNIGF
ncbi:PD40 domain-containing protein [Chryseolinea soli]|uniref:Uncharacterized protein n=1 Tax=Chryseolinea soli TaxID=2321403 RepID=A0A385SQF2_9BACT|nr:PD40 domain-containing protein [Chryseolinea soli]AYB34023.1 hypothetical protein D4L85_27115 [Chryseolinea soli]